MPDRVGVRCRPGTVVMTNSFYLGLGVSVAFFFVRYAMPAMPKIVAWAGVLAGIVVMLAEMLDPVMKPPLGSVVLFVIAALCLGGAAHLYIHRSGAIQPANPGTAQGGNQMGNVSGNTGIVTQDQKGDNSISK